MTQSWAMIADLPATVSLNFLFSAYIIIRQKVAKVVLSALSISYLPMAAYIISCRKVANDTEG